MADAYESKAEAHAVSSLKKPADYRRHVKALLNRRQRRERGWKLNLAFYKGNQYVYFNKSANRIESLPVDDGDKPRYRVRLVWNQIRPGVRSKVAKMTKTRPTFHATPTSGSDQDLKAAQLSERLFESWWRMLNLPAKRDEAIYWSQIASQGYWHVTWDAQAGEEMEFVLAPDGTPITDDRIKDLFLAQLAQEGIEPEIRRVALGEVNVTTRSPFDVILDDSVPVFEDCNFAYVTVYMPCDEIERRWGVTLKPDAVAGDPDISLPFGKEARGGEKTVVKLYIGYFKPSLVVPEGKYVVFADQEYDRFLEQGPWPFPFKELPLVKFPGINVPGSVYDDSPTDDARPMQKELNRTVSQIVEYKNLTIKPRIFAPVGSLRQRMTGEPGALYLYQPIAGMKPEIEQLPALPPYVFEHLSNLVGRLREVYNRQEVSEGTLPPNLEAGVAIDLLQETAADEIAPDILLMENSIAKAGQLLLMLAKENYEEDRLIRSWGSTSSHAFRFKQADFRGDADLWVEAGSGLPRTRAGRMQRIQQLIDIGLVRPDQAWKHYDLADLRSIGAKFAADEDLANREHEKLIQGAPLNAVAVQSAMQAVNAGVNPETGEPIRDEAEAQEILFRASLQPGVADQHGVHLETHAMEIKSPAFEQYPPEIQGAFYTHYQLHQEAMAAESSPEPQAPRVTYQIKGTAGPTTASKLLDAAGVRATPAEMTEPPLETWVTDSMDKPDMDTAGNDQMDDLERQMAEEELRKKKAQADKAEKDARAPVTSG